MKSTLQVSAILTFLYLRKREKFHRASLRMKQDLLIEISFFKDKMCCLRDYLYKDGKFGHRWEGRSVPFERRYHLFRSKSAEWRKRLDTTSGQRRDNRLSGWLPCILRAVYRWKTNREAKRKGSCTQLPRCDIDFFPFNAHNGLSLSGLKKFQPACCLEPDPLSSFPIFFFFYFLKEQIIRGNCNSKIWNNSEREREFDYRSLFEKAVI